MTKKALPNPAKQSDGITAYKGFDQNMRCRGYQFEVGKLYEHDGEVKTCSSGFHSCEYPLDVFSYYGPDSSRFAVVKATGAISRHPEDSKVASAKITVEAEIGLPVLIARAVDWVLTKIDASIQQTVVTGDRSAATNTGYRSAATNTGDYSAATNTGDRSAAEVKGFESVAAALGIQGRARAAAGGAIVLCCRDENDGRLIHIRASKVGENGIKPDVWYSLNEVGEFVEVETK